MYMYGGHRQTDYIALSLSILLFLTCVWCIHVECELLAHVCLHAEAKGQHWASSPEHLHFTITILLCMCVGVVPICTWVYVGGCATCLHMEAREEHQVPSSLLSVFIPSRQVLSLNLEFSIWEQVWQPESPSVPLPTCHAATPPALVLQRTCHAQLFPGVPGI